MPIPDIEKLTPHLERYTLRNFRVLDDSNLVTVVGPAPQVRYSGAVTRIEVEPIGRLESLDIKQPR